MKIVVLGASQGTGALAVKEALGRGHEVTGFARTPERIGVQHEKLRLVVGDFHDPTSVREAIKGHDAVIIAVGVSSPSAFKDQPQFFSEGTRYAIAAMKEHGCKRLVVLSALGVGDSRRLMAWPFRALFIDWLLRGSYRDHETQERMVRESGLDWVIARPSVLKDRPGTHEYRKTKALERVPMFIARADLAHFLVDACEQDSWLGAAVHLGG